MVGAGRPGRQSPRIGALFSPKTGSTRWRVGKRSNAPLLWLRREGRTVRRFWRIQLVLEALPMFRRLLLPCACLSVAVVAMSAPPAWSQDRSTQERLERLERDLNMLQRQVYRGAPAPGGGGGGGAGNTEIRMDRLEAQVRDLTGHVEACTNKIAQHRQRVEQVNSEAEAPLGQGW